MKNRHQSYVRVIPELRSVHLAELEAMEPETIFYLEENWDLSNAFVPSFCSKLGTWGITLALFSSRASTLELFEPFWVRHLWRNVLMLTAWKAGAFLRQSKRETVLYAIENNDFESIVFGRRHRNNLFSALLFAFLRLIYKNAFDRIVFGSQGSSETYSRLLAGSRSVSRVITELQKPDPQFVTGVNTEGFVFVARMEERKGIRLLLETWEAVERLNPRAQLTLVGDGPLGTMVSDWAKNSEQRLYLGHLEWRSVKEVLHQNRVLVAPSIRWGRWREQISLPICEALAVGLSVATTSETGLATWLEQSGHLVFSPDAETNLLAEQLIDFAKNPLSPHDVRASLPNVSGRVESSRWLHKKSF